MPKLPPWLSEHELAVYAGAFERTGFTGGLNWYRNIDRNWELTESVADRHVVQPAFFLTGELDPARRLCLRPPCRAGSTIFARRSSFPAPGIGCSSRRRTPSTAPCSSSSQASSSAPSTAVARGHIDHVSDQIEGRPDGLLGLIARDADVA